MAVAVYSKRPVAPSSLRDGPDPHNRAGAFSYIRNVRPLRLLRCSLQRADQLPPKRVAKPQRFCNADCRHAGAP